MITKTGQNCIFSRIYGLKTGFLLTYFKTRLAKLGEIRKHFVNFTAKWQRVFSVIFFMIHFSTFNVRHQRYIYKHIYRSLKAHTKHKQWTFHTSKLSKAPITVLLSQATYNKFPAQLISIVTYFSLISLWSLQSCTLVISDL